MVFHSKFALSQPDARHKQLVSHFFWHQLDRFASNCLFVDQPSKRRWSGQQIKSAAARVATNLIRQLDPNSNQLQNADCLLLVSHSDYSQILALACLFAGASVCAWAPDDTRHEQMHIVATLRPSLVFVEWQFLEKLRSIRAELELNFKLCIFNDNQLPPEGLHNFASNDQEQFLLFHHQLLQLTDSSQVPPSHAHLPVEVDPERPAFILLTSGSTGRPKLVSRSQRNSICVCHMLEAEAGRRLWPLDQSSVLAGHLPLDHGTGVFSLKITLAKGLCLIIMPSYQQDEFLSATVEHQITDCLLGSAYLHALLLNQLADSKLESPRRQLASMRNLLAVGSAIASAEVANKFMRLYGQCSVRQAFGATECGFIAIEERERVLEAAARGRPEVAADERQPVGLLVPGVSIKLLHLESTGVEIREYQRHGQLLVRSPALSPGYLGPRETRALSSRLFPNPRHAHLDKSSAVSDEHFYKTNDIVSMRADQQLVVHGRMSEILNLTDGWKVLPQELELLLMTHPEVQEAAIVAIPHPHLATCHMARAYVVAQSGAKASEKDLFEFVAERVAEPKQLIGGVKLVNELPRLSVGKVDKRQLLKADGLL